VTKVLVATPTFDSKVCNEYLLSLMQSREQIEFGVFLIPGIHFLEMARDIAVAKFLRSDAEYLFFIDSDLGWQPDAIKRLVDHNKPVVGGAYRIKYDDELYPNYGVLVEEDGLLRVSMLPGGFTCIRRDVLEHLWNSLPHYNTAHIGEVASVFSRELHDGVMVSEDAMFSRRAAPFGLWLDPSIDFIHVGTKAYHGNYARSKSC
jgi:hypothetical protein